MYGTGSGFGRVTAPAEWRAARCMAVALCVAASGLIAAPAPSKAAPIAPSRGTDAGSAVELIREYCGHGLHRENKQRNKAGAWVGKCVPNKPKTQPPAGQPASPPPNQPG
jgi:hypothetical protein